VSVTPEVARICGRPQDKYLEVGRARSRTNRGTDKALARLVCAGAGRRHSWVSRTIRTWAMVRSCGALIGRAGGGWNGAGGPFQHPGLTDVASVGPDPVLPLAKDGRENCEGIHGRAVQDRCVPARRSPGSNYRKVHPSASRKAITATRGGGPTPTNDGHGLVPQGSTMTARTSACLR